MLLRRPLIVLARQKLSPAQAPSKLINTNVVYYVLVRF